MFALLYFLPLALIFDATGYLPPYLRLFLTYLLLAAPLCLKPSRTAIGGAAALGILLVLQATFQVPPVAELLLLVIAHQFIWASLFPIAAAVSSGVVFYSFLHIFLFLSPIGHPFIEGLTAAGNKLNALISGNTRHLGFTWQNISGFLLFLCLSLFAWDRSRIATIRTGIFIAVAVFINALVTTVLLEQVNFGAEFAWKLEYRDPFGYRQLWEHVKGLVLLVFPFFNWLLYMTAYLVLHHRRGEEEEEEPEVLGTRALCRSFLPRTRTAQGLALVAVLMVLVTIPPTSRRSPKPVDVVYVEKGVVSFTRPDYTRFGRAAGGMFGMLPDYTRLYGCTASVVKEIPDTLEPNQVLVLTNTDFQLEPEVHKRVWDFVEAGGKLWVLGDHTFIKNGRNHVNDLLAPCHIELLHDSAQFFPQGWFHSYHFHQGTPFAALTDEAENRPAILVGASLKLGRPAQPFVTGTFGYSDWGTSAEDDQRGHIGDFEYQASERLGDLVLVAGERYGKGKVLVFGDTSSFFSNNMSRSCDLLRASLSWLGESNGWSMPASTAGRILVLMLLIGFTALMFLARADAAGLTALPVVALAAFLLHQPGTWLPYDAGFSRSRLALIDYSLQPYASRHSSMNSGLHGLTLNMLRHGLLPVSSNHWSKDAVKQAQVIALNAPRQPIRGARRRSLEQFMQRGGTVIMGCGYHHYANAKGFLGDYGLGISGTPLGRFFDKQAFGRPVSFHSAWPIEIDRDDATVLCMYNEDWPLMVSVPVGAGKLILIGDSEFLHNRNTEGFENHDPANTTFLRSLLDYVRGAPK